MTKPTSNKLFVLIKSMNRGEVKFFRNFASRNDQVISMYQKLFETMLNSKENDELSFFSTLYPKESKMNKFQVLKYDLFNLILKSLRLYHDELSVMSRIRTSLHNVEILTHKGLYQESFEYLSKAIRLSESRDLDVFQSEFYYWKFKIAFLSTDLTGMAELGNTEVKVMEDQVFRFKSGIFAVQNFAALFSKVRSAGLLRDPEELRKLIKWMDKLQPIDKRDSTFIVHLKKYLAGINAYVRTDSQAFYESLKDLVNQIKLDIENNQLDATAYFYFTPALGDLAHSCLYLKRYDELMMHIEEMEKCISQLPKNQHFRLYKRIYLLRLLYCAETGDFETSYRLCEEAKALEKKFESSFPINLTFLNAYACFGLEKFDEAIDLLNNLTNLKSHSRREDLLALARIFKIICVFEQRDDFRSDYLDSLVLSTYRYLKKRKRLFAFEKLFLSFVKKLVYRKPDVTIKMLFAQLKIETEKIMEDNIEKEVLHYFDFIAWLDAKLTNTSFAKQARKRSLTKS